MTDRGRVDVVEALAGLVEAYDSIAPKPGDADWEAYSDAVTALRTRTSYACNWPDTDCNCKPPFYGCRYPWRESPSADLTDAVDALASLINDAYEAIDCSGEAGERHMVNLQRSMDSAREAYRRVRGEAA